MLSPNQRAVLILRDVLGWSASEAAQALDTSVASANSALHRARATMQRHRSTAREEWVPPAEPSDAERALLRRYVEAHHRADLPAVVSLLREDVRFTMPPNPQCHVGRDALTALFADAFGGRVGDFRLVPTMANRQPAAANYLRAPGESRYRAFALDVLRVEDGRIAEITTFEPTMFPDFGLPPVLE